MIFITCVFEYLLSLRSLKRYLPLDNETFIQGINRRDTEAYKQIYDRYYRILVVYAENFLGNNGTSEDIVQDIIVNIWEAKMTFVSYNTFKTYLYNSVRNGALNYLKHQGVAEKYLEHLAQTYSPIDESEVNEEEIYRRLFAIIDRLPTRCREIFLLCMDGKKNSEIATELHLSIETVKTQKKRAMAYIREHLDKSYLWLLFIVTENMMLSDLLIDC